ncbi:unnamed protein product [Moneuplotes crassus]|uniref:Uncharacterized protein n=1 Tax=Euplotes crassus TaxID=5936 RepID=A0AAD2D8T6_EUPCR|nr:unnamed protein product [Moneuplotes crassus]
MKARILSPASRAKKVLGSTPKLDQKVKINPRRMGSSIGKADKIKSMAKLNAQFYTNFFTSAGSSNKCDEKQEDQKNPNMRSSKNSKYHTVNSKLRQESTDTNSRPKNSARITQSPLQSKVDLIRTCSMKNELFTKLNLKTKICGISLKNSEMNSEVVQDILAGIMECETDPYLQPINTNSKQIQSSLNIFDKAQKNMLKYSSSGKKERNLWQSSQQTKTQKNVSTKATNNFESRQGSVMLQKLNTHRVYKSPFTGIPRKKSSKIKSHNPDYEGF